MSTVDVPPHKRQRTSDTSDGSDLYTGIKCSEKLWFHDGNVVLQAEHTRFRVHQSVLERHSSVFKDMFSLPQPPVLSEIGFMADGCPLIHLSDLAEDVSIVLELLYDGARFMRTILLEQVSAMARLGRKYEITFMEQAARAYLGHDYPASLAKWDLLSRQTPTIEPKFGKVTGVLNLASEMDWREVMPAAYLRYLYDANHSSGLEGLFGNTMEPPLLAGIHLKALIGRERLVMFLNEKYRAEYQDSFGPYSSWDCCAGWLDDKIRSFEALTPLIRRTGQSSLLPPYETVLRPFGIKLCTNCESRLRRRYESVRVEAWSRLPSFFDLGSWEDLAEDDHD